MACKDIELPDGVAPEVAGEVYREVLATLKEGDELEVCAGVFETGNLQPLINPAAGIEVFGQGQGRTIIRNGYQGVKQFCASFEAHDRSKFRDLDLVCSVTNNQQGACVGFGRADAFLYPGYKLTLERCGIYTMTQGIYNWNNNRNLIEVKDCDLYFARWAICACGSGGFDSQYIDIHGSRFHGDSSLSIYPGAVGRRLIGLAARGGRIRCWDSQFDLKGDPTMAAVRGAWIDGEGSSDAGAGSPWTVVELYRNDFRLIANGAKQCFDLDPQIGTMTAWEGTGSAPNGDYIQSGRAIIHKAA